MKEERILVELALIEKRHGILKPEDVVSFAENPQTALHGKFNWDDTEAAALYRIYQARQLIRVVVTITAYSPIPQRVYVSLTTDRYDDDGGGYRPIVRILSDKDLREQLLADAINEMEIFKSKYHGLKELARVFEEMEKISIKKSKKRTKQAEMSATA